MDYYASNNQQSTSSHPPPPPPPLSSSSASSFSRPTLKVHSNDGTTLAHTPKSDFPILQQGSNLLLQTPLSPNSINNPNMGQGPGPGAGPGQVQVQVQGPMFNQVHNRPTPTRKRPMVPNFVEFPLPQPFNQEYINYNNAPQPNYLPSPRRHISSTPTYLYHDSAQKAAVDNYYHKNYDDLQNRRLTTAYEDHVSKLPKRNPEVLPQLPWSTGNSVTTAVPAPPAPPSSQSQQQPHPDSPVFMAKVSSVGPTHVPSPPTTARTNSEAATCAIRKNTQEVLAKSIAERHRSRPISEYATIVRQAEIAVLNMDPQNHSKTVIQNAEQNRERERQVYALLWLMKNCASQPDSYVPRGRIFAQYAASCAQNSLKPLSQASLGKLIRSVFPDLTTRRLGMRGQSRYHYCGLRLVLDDPEQDSALQIGSPSSCSMDRAESSSLPTSNSTVNTSDVTRNRSVSSETGSSSKSLSPEIPKLEPSPISLGQFSNDYDMVFVEDLFKKVFANHIPIPSEYSLKFPRIPLDNLPAGTDPDIVSSLESLYHVHCNTVFEHIRFMKFDQLENVLMLFGSGSISPQMYNLFISDELYDWIHECDLITHVSLIKYLSRMIMDYENVSNEVLTKLETFSKNYVSLVTKATIDLPVPMVTKKKDVVENFSRLLRKLVKYLKFSKQITKLLPNFKSMRDDWESYVNLDDVLDVVKRDGYDEVIKIIKTFMTINIPDFLDELTAGHVRLDKFVKNFCELLSSIRDVPAYKLMDGITLFSRAFMADISLTLQQRGLPWYFLDMLASLLVGYCFEINRFIS